MKPDRMAAHEAPRVGPVRRQTRNVVLHLQGRRTEGTAQVTVTVPADMKAPDVITYRGHTFARRTDANYSEASMWPILEDLDAI